MVVKNFFGLHTVQYLFAEYMVGSVRLSVPLVAQILRTYMHARVGIGSERMENLVIEHVIVEDRVKIARGLTWAD